LKELPKVYFERLLETSPDIVVAVDRVGTLIFYNDGATDTLGYRAEEVLGTHVARFYRSKAAAAEVMAAMRSAEIDGAGFVKNFETEFLAKDGNWVPVAISGSIIYDGAGRELGSIGFAKDIGALRRHEQLVTLGELAVGLAHEINNPLEVLVNQVEMIERFLKAKAESTDYSRAHHRITQIKRELRRIQAIVERVGEMAAQGDYDTCEYLPGRLMADLGIAEEDGAGVPPAPAPERPAHHVAGKTVLVVDDDGDILTSMADILGCEGCNVLTTHSGNEALRILDERTVDLVLSDVMMPDMDGYELFQRIQTTHNEVPVVLMTAYYYDKEHVIKRSKAQGLSDVIFKKPIDPARLLELVDARASD
jgi:PAS domain S-box-containing protein